MTVSLYETLRERLRAQRPVALVTVIKGPGLGSKLYFGKWFALRLDVRDHIGVDRILLETDYPHLDGTWPDSQEVNWRALQRLPEDERHAVAWRNAADLFRFPVAPSVVADPQNW